MKIDSLVPDIDAYRVGWAEWVNEKTEGNKLELYDKVSNLTADYWDCKKAFTAGWREGQRCIDE